MLEPTRAASKTVSELTSLEKAAIVLVALGKEVSSQVMRNLPDIEIERLTTEIARLKHIDSETEMAVLHERVRGAGQMTDRPRILH